MLTAPLSAGWEPNWCAKAIKLLNDILWNKGIPPWRGALFRLPQIRCKEKSNLFIILAPGPKKPLGAKYLTWSFGNTIVPTRVQRAQRSEIPAPKGKAGSLLPNRARKNCTLVGFVFIYCVSGSKSANAICLSRWWSNAKLRKIRHNAMRMRFFLIRFLCTARTCQNYGVYLWILTTLTL